MSGTHQKKYLENGKLNAKWKPRNQSYQPKYLSTGDENPKYRYYNKPLPPQKPASEKYFIAWDGEGINYGAPVEGVQQHKYILLANSQDKYIYNKDGLRSHDCFDLLITSSINNSNAINVVFGGSYDINCMLRTLPKTILQKIADSNGAFCVLWYKYHIKYIPRKCLTIYRFRNPDKLFKLDKNDKFVPDYDARVVLWDVIGFFQSTFITAIEKWLGADYPDLKDIAAGKTKRDSFNHCTLDYIMKYNKQELTALVSMMDILHDSMNKLELKITRWDGAGAVAAAMCKKHNVKKAFTVVSSTGQKQRLELPQQVQEACQYAYFGGRIECLKYGRYLNPVYHYDKNSAYPSGQLYVPDLVNGKWQHHNNPQLNNLQSFSLIKVKWTSKHLDVCPFPYRSNLQRKILYPENGIGWYWFPEVEQACKAALNNPFYKSLKIELLEAWEFIPSSQNYYPYEFIKSYYNYRQELINDSLKSHKPNGQEKIIKLGLNSLYGKTAQHIGYNVENGNIPPYHNLAYAGYVTSTTRADIFKSASQKPNSIIAIMTDGLFSTQPLEVPISSTKELGKWESKVHDGIIMVQSGFYWTLKDGRYLGWSRGFDKIVGKGRNESERRRDYQLKYQQQIDLILNAWRNKIPEVYLPCTRFITLKTALVSDTWFDRWCTWYQLGYKDFLAGEFESPGRRLKITPQGTKRLEIPYYKNRDLTPADILFNTIPEHNFTPNDISDLYILPWEKNQDNENEIEGVPILEMELEHQESWS